MTLFARPHNLFLGTKAHLLDLVPLQWEGVATGRDWKSVWSPISPNFLSSSRRELCWGKLNYFVLHMERRTNEAISSAARGVRVECLVNSKYRYNVFYPSCEESPT